MYFIGDWFSDNAIMSSILDEIEFYIGREWNLIRPDGTKYRQKIKAKKNGGSMLYGVTWRGFLAPGKLRTRRGNLFQTKIVDDYPELEYIFSEFAQLYFPDFEYKNVQMNKNFECRPHIDSKNIGMSIVCAFGDYQGGDLVVEDEKIDIQEKPYKFNGSEKLHWVEPFEGTRYSLVFFNTKQVH